MPKYSLLILFLMLCIFATPAARSSINFLQFRPEVLPRSSFTIDLYKRAPDAEPLEPLSSEDINQIPGELENMRKIAEQMDESLARMERQVATMKTDLNIATEQINKGFNPSQQELDKYATGKIDISEKEMAQGIAYDIDIFDHARKLNLSTTNWEEMKEKYSI